MNSIDWQQQEELKADWQQDQDKKVWQARIRQLRLELHEERANKRTQDLERKAESPPAPEQSHSEALNHQWHSKRHPNLGLERRQQISFGFATGFLWAVEMAPVGLSHLRQLGAD